MLRLIATLSLMLGLAVASAAAKGTGLIYVSNEKRNNILVIDSKGHKIFNDIAVRGGCATCISMPITQSSS
jgi:translation initiation factor IF-2